MSILSTLNFFVFLVYSCLFFYLLRKGEKELLNRVCAAFIGSFILWSFILIFFFQPGISKETALLLDNIASIGWLSFASFYLWFALIFTADKIITSTPFFYAIIFILPLIFIYKKWTGFIIADYVKLEWGWAGIWSQSFWTYLYFIYYLSFTTFALYLFYHYSKKTSNFLKQKQAQIIFYTSLISLIISTLIEVIIPLLTTIKTPSSANIINLVLLAGMVWSIAKYRLMVAFTYTAAAEQIISAMADSLVLLDKNGNIISGNDALLNITGYKKNELIGKPVSILFRKRDCDKLFTGNMALKEIKKGLELNLKNKNGKLLPILLSGSPIISEGGEITAIVCNLTEINELKKTKDILRESQKEALSLFENNPIAGMYEDEKGNILNVNRKFIELFDYTLSELRGKKAFNGMIFPDQKGDPKYARITWKALTKGDVRFETIRKKKDGTLVPVIVSGSIIVNNNQKKIMAVFYQDISKEKEYLLRLEENERKFRTVFQNMPVGYYQTDNEGNILIMNPAGIRMLGYQSTDEVIGKNIAREFYYNPEDRDAFLKSLAENGGEVKDYEVTLIDREGSPFVVSTNSHYYYNESGIANGVEGIFVDITDRKKNENLLKYSQQEFASLFHSHSEALLYFDEKGIILDANKRFNELFGYTLAEIKGRDVNIENIVPPDRYEEGKELDKKTISEGTIQIETIRQKKDGTLFRVLVSSSAVYIDEKLKGIITAYTDITERKELENQLQKMANTDTLCGCYNRLHGLELLKRQMKLTDRSKSPLLIAFVDIDGLKQINDRFGHPEGDRAIKIVCNLFKSTLREIDIICRMGGDEFLLVFPDSSLKQSSLIKDRFERKLNSVNRNIRKDYQINFSIGFAEYLPLTPLTQEELITIADRRMYMEKEKK